MPSLEPAQVLLLAAAALVAGAVNAVAGVAAIAFALLADVGWVAVGVMAAASLIGGQLGSSSPGASTTRSCAGW